MYNKVGEECVLAQRMKLFYAVLRIKTEMKKGERKK